MTNFGSLLHSPGTQPFEITEDKAAQLVELRTDTGTVYVRVTGWQRIRLQWIFRNFHVVSAPVLGRRDQRLIAHLAEHSAVRPDRPVPGTHVLGVIEKMPSRPAVDAEPVSAPASSGQVWSLSLGHLGALTAIAVVVILASALPSRTLPVSKTRAAAATFKKADGAARAAVPEAVLTVAAPLPRVTKTTKRLAPEEAVIVPPVQVAAVAERPQVSELPPGHFAHPMVAQGNAEGEVQLKVLIGTDGLVKDVTVVRGDPRLAEAGVRAVRQWHYRPHEESGQPVEVETQVKMKFFGQDAVSIASIAEPSTPLVGAVR